MEGAQHQEQWQATHESRARRVTSSYQQSRTKNTRECHAELLKSHAIPQLPLIANGYDKLNNKIDIWDIMSAVLHMTKQHYYELQF